MTTSDVIFAPASQHSPIYPLSEWLKDWIQIYGDISIDRFEDVKIWKHVYEACVPQGFPAKLPRPPVGSAYAFINNSGHNVLALTEKAPQDLVALATLYYSTQVAGQARGTEEAKCRDLSRFLAFSDDPLRHSPPRHGVNPTS